MYQGHLPDGSSVQRHSAGGLYPFVIYARQRAERLVYGYIDPRDGSEHLVGSHDEAVACVEALKAKRDLHDEVLTGLLACDTPVPEQEGNHWLRRARRVHDSALTHDAFRN